MNHVVPCRMLSSLDNCTELIPLREVISKYIVVDMYAKAIQGMPAEEAAKWAHAECAKVYV